MATTDADIIVVGGGAAGLATAIFTARRDSTLRALILDGAPRLGAKILVSGGGRCNVTNRVVTAADFHGGSRHVVKRVLAALPVEATIAFFRELGVQLHEEEHGKLFPNSNAARTVLAALLDEAARHGVRVLAGHRVVRITRGANGFEVWAMNSTFTARRLVLATGGQSFPKTGSDGHGYVLAESLGHTLVPRTPALVPLVLDGDFHTPLAGVSHDVVLTVRAAGEKPVHVRGSLLWTHFGISGPAALDASRHWLRARSEKRDVTLTANFAPDLDGAARDAWLRAQVAAHPKAQLENVLAGMVPSRVAAALLAQLRVAPAIPLAHLPKDVRRQVVQALTAWPVPVHDSRGYGKAEVTAGGVPLSEVDSATLASRRCDGLYFAGEILDVDGRLGGFNFQWSWASAMVVARALAERTAPQPM